MEKMLLSYFVKDYEFLSNVDSVKDFVKHGYYYDPFRDLLYAKLKALINSGKLKETLKDVENESDRAFIYLFLRGCFESKETMTPLVEKYKFQVTKRKQLTYLVRRFWFRKEFDLEHFLAASVGGGLVVPFGSLSDKVNLGGAMDVAVDYMSDKHFYEGFLLINGSGVVNPDSLQFFDIGLIFNYGYRFFKKKYLNLYGYGSVGLGFDGLNASEEEMKNGDLDLPSQVYPSLGAGLEIPSAVRRRVRACGYAFGRRSVVGLILQATVVSGIRLLVHSFGVIDLTHDRIEVRHDVDTALVIDERRAFLHRCQCPVVVFKIIT